MFLPKIQALVEYLRACLVLTSRAESFADVRTEAAALTV
jgi:hypothetical protein